MTLDQSDVARILQRHVVIKNISGLIAALIKGNTCSEELDDDTIYELSVVLDYESILNDVFNVQVDMDYTSLSVVSSVTQPLAPHRRWLHQFHQRRWNDMLELFTAVDQEAQQHDDYDTLQRQYDGYQREVFEHWLIAQAPGLFFDAMSAIGERIVAVCGVDVWCRTTTGQSISLDNCIQKAAQALALQYAST